MLIHLMRTHGSKRRSCRNLRELRPQFPAIASGWSLLRLSFKPSGLVCLPRFSNLAQPQHSVSSKS
jgi:hypothetical protein